MRGVGTVLFMVGVVMLFCSCDILKASQSITPEQQARLDDLGKREKAAQDQVADILAKQKAGTLSAADVAVALGSILPTMAQTANEISALKKEIASQSGTGGLGALGVILLSIFGRSGLHGLSFVASALPPPFGIIATGITGLLGGSQSHDPSPSVPAAPPKPA